MPEQCPLAFGGMDNPPSDICQRQCFELWDAAVSKGHTWGSYDVYRSVLDSPDECCDDDYVSLEFSSEGIQALQTGSAERLYSIVDECVDCGREYGEQSYKFRCPFNDLSMPEIGDSPDTE